LRQHFLDRHNELRSSLAKGETEKNGDKGIAPPAKLMYTLEYDCDAESYAQQHANTCDEEVLPQSGRPGYKENIFSYKDTSGTPKQAADAVGALEAAHEF
uniref:SCP domain-containing protein n=1 Tax=Heligmosomoides polygyrus TaxID=6339 RepID=A0A183GWG2_HELPZ